MKELKLWKHQEKIIEEAPLKTFLFWACGLGKSLAAIRLSENYGLDKTLIICPKKIKEDWNDKVKELAIVPSNYDIYTKEEFKKYSTSLCRYDKLILDEVHYFSLYKSQLTKSLLVYIKKHNPKQIYGMTATPFLSTSWNIFTYGLLIGRPWRWVDWNRKFFMRIQMGIRMIPIEKKKIGPHKITDYLAAIVNRIGDTVKLEDCFDIPEQQYRIENFDLTQSQQKAIGELNDIEDIVYWNKCHQISGGTLKGDEYTESMEFNCNKFTRAIEYIKNNNKTVIVCRYTMEIDMFKRYFSKNHIENYEEAYITGATKDSYNDVKRVEASEKAVVFVNAACSEGYELPSFPLMIFYSNDFSLKNRTQIMGRIQRANNLKKNVYIDLINNNSIDVDVKNSLDRKEDFDIAIYKRK